MGNSRSREEPTLRNEDTANWLSNESKPSVRPSSMKYANRSTGRTHFEWMNGLLRIPRNKTAASQDAEPVWEHAAHAQPVEAVSSSRSSHRIPNNPSDHPQRQNQHVKEHGNAEKMAELNAMITTND